MENVLITNGGAHSPEDWAAATASHIVEIANTVTGEARNAAIKLQARILDILEGHHTTVQDGERAHIAKIGHDRILHSLDCNDHLSLDECVIEITEATIGTKWESTFAQMETQINLKVLLANHFHTNMQIERSWHADRNHTTEQAKAFHAKHNLGAK